MAAQQPTAAHRDRQPSLRMSAEYRAWCQIKTRCYNRRSKSWHNYGGRGIMMCARWLNDFPAFLADVGKRPSPKHSLDRINNDGNYEPGNCRWATQKEQCRNKRVNRLLTIKGVTKTLVEWCEESGVNYNTTIYRIDGMGWDAERALSEPLLTRAEYNVSLKGAEHQNAKLTESQVREIRRLWEAGTSQCALARQFGMSRSRIQFIVYRLGWKHLA